ncbi:MAG: hypothetical protein AAGD25_37905, partial [Cyanobacteria bacterium P01_F01_bin.150]
WGVFVGRQNAHALRLQAVGDSAFQAVLFCSQILDGEEWKYSRSLTEGAIALPLLGRSHPSSNTQGDPTHPRRLLHSWSLEYSDVY